MGINLIGKSTAKDIAKYCKGDVDVFTFIMSNTSLEFSAIEGVGVAATTSLDDWWQNNLEMFYELLEELEIANPEEKKETVNTNGNSIEGMTFVVTGSVNHFKNRSELQERIEQLGGKVVGSVSAKTSVLLNNDSESNSSKNIKAKSLNIPIWTEEDFLKYIGELN
jgi:DNA ligase (NAD+)